MPSSDTEDIYDTEDIHDTEDTRETEDIPDTEDKTPRPILSTCLSDPLNCSKK